MEFSYMYSATHKKFQADISSNWISWMTTDMWWIKWMAMQGCEIKSVEVSASSYGCQHSETFKGHTVSGHFVPAT